MSMFVPPRCSKGQCPGHVWFVPRIVEPPLEGMEKLGVHDLQCDVCHHVFARNVGDLKFDLTLRQTKKLIRRIADETEREVTVVDVLDRWPIENRIVNLALREFNEEG